MTSRDEHPRGPPQQAQGPQLSRPTAVLDEAHLGDIEGALGRIKLSEEDTERRGLRRKLITFLAIVGPGLIVMVGDNDAGGVSTYAQAHALQMHGGWYGAAFSIVLLDASIIGASAVTLSTSYAFGDVFGIKHSLHRKFREAKPFYATYVAMIAASGIIVLIPAPRSACSPRRCRPWPGSCCPARARSWYCCATTARCSARG